MKLIQVILNKERGYVTADMDLLCEELRQLWENDPKPGDSIAFEVVEVTKEELEAAPEFQGW